jgi:zinc protease
MPGGHLIKSIVEELKNGMKIVMRPTDRAKVTAFQIWVGVGSTDEQKGEEGLAHVLEHMLFKGTQRRAVGDIAKDVERAGGQINAWTSYEETVYYITLADQFWEQGLDILADAVQNSALDADELSRELKVILEEIRMGEDAPDQVLVKELFGAAFKKHPYGRPIIGYEKTVKSFTRQKVSDFYRKWYIPKNMVLSIAGNFDCDRMLKQVKQLFEAYAPTARLEKGIRPKEPIPTSPRFASAVKPVSEARFAVSFPIPGLLHQDVPMLDLLAGIVGQGMSARLERKIRRELNLVTDIRAMAYTPSDMGVFAVFGTCPHHLLEKAVAATLKELSAEAMSSMSMGELKKAQTLIEADSIYSEETVDGLARKAGFYLLHAKDSAYEEKYLQAVQKTEVQHIKEAVSTYLVGNSATIAVVIPDPKRRAPKKAVPWIEGKAKNRALNVSTLKARMTALLAAHDKPFKKSKQPASVLPTTVEYTLSSGDLLLVRKDPTARIVAARAAFLGGVRFENKKNAGLFALMSNTLVRGTREASAEDVAALMDTLACSISGFSGRNTFGIQGEFLQSNFSDGFALMAACLRTPTFEAGEVELERQLLLEDIRQSADNPSKQAFKLCFENLFQNHPYSRLSHGTEESIGNLHRDTLARTLSSVTAPGRMVLAVAGGVEPEEIRIMAETLLRSDKKAPSPPKDPTAWKPLKHPKAVTLSLPKEQSHVVVGFPGTTLTGNDRFAVEILIEVLGGHGGRLFQSVREEKGLAYSVTAVSMEGIEPGYLALYAGTSPGSETKVIDALQLEAKRIAAEKVTKDELLRVKRHLIGSRAISLQRTSSRAAAMALDQLYGNGHDACDRYIAQIDGVTADQVVEAAKRYLSSPGYVVVCVGPKADRLKLM